MRPTSCGLELCVGSCITENPHAMAISHNEYTEANGIQSNLSVLAHKGLVIKRF